MARLGYSQYFAQGGDWGSVITSYIARQDPKHCLGIHINMGIVAPDPNAENLTANELSIMAGWKYCKTGIRATLNNKLPASDSRI